MINKNLDDIDRKIIGALEKDAYLSSAELSKQLGIVASTIRYRVNRLINNNIIRIQAVQINRARTSLTVSIMLKVENNAIDRTADFLASRPEVGFLVLTAGHYNIVILSWFESVETYSKFLKTVLYPLKGVLETDLLICTEYRKYAFMKMQGSSNALKPASKPVDEIDMKIIQALEKDAHQNSTKVAKSLNISAATVRRKITELLSNNIIHIQAFPNIRMGKTIVAVIALKVDNGSLNRIADYLSEMDETRQVLIYTGTYNIGIWAWFESIAAFSEFLNNVLNPMEGVQKTIIAIQTEIIKWAHMW
jgi:DNA-binding Lrp family transcriptional regulator